MKRIIDSLAVTIFSLSIIGLGVIFLDGCAGWGKTACQVVDATENACSTIRFMGTDGGVQSVNLSADETKEIRANDGCEEGGCEASGGGVGREVKDDPKLRPLTPAEAKCSLAAKLNSTVDKFRQVEVKLGFRPYQVFLTWTTWDGTSEGTECSE